MTTSPGRIPWRSGRPPISNPKSRVVKIRVTPEEHASLKSVARNSGMSVSDLMRTGALNLGARCLRANALESRLRPLLAKLVDIAKRTGAGSNFSADRAEIAQIVTALSTALEGRIDLTPGLGRTLTQIALRLRRARSLADANIVDALLTRIDAIIAQAAA